MESNFGGLDDDMVFFSILHLPTWLKDSATDGPHQALIHSSRPPYYIDMTGASRWEGRMEHVQVPSFVLVVRLPESFYT